MLCGVQILRNLDEEVIDDIGRHIKITDFEANQLVVEKGHMGDRIYFIFEGRVEVRIPDDNGGIKRRILLKKGEVVGEISLLINSTYSADIVALDDTRAFYLDREHFEKLVEDHPGFAEVMTQLMTSRMGHDGGINQVGKYELRGKLGE
ncbi:MAG: cyclic nucleotide-binding domain-containing protein, partial [Gammaproteobacteria bacterium]